VSRPDVEGLLKHLGARREFTGSGAIKHWEWCHEMTYGKTGFAWRAAPAIVDDNSHDNEGLLRAWDRSSLSDLHAQLFSRWRLPFPALRSPVPARRPFHPSGIAPSGQCGSLSSFPISAG
jgi:hypothetical protein